ncbi:malectin domain-containing carbohydrate-binding protein [Spongiimicrobium salis]|uniref:malectin domain-containing carbohydrate-binding protein n=1 Tax=Spongiimicrobium salis TaxID=1667022 RepID=UPI00374CB05C
MKKNYPKTLVFFKTTLLLLFLSVFSSTVTAQSFTQNNLDFNGNEAINLGTSLMFGPDGRLYAAEYAGIISIYTIQRNSPGDYIVTDREELNQIQSIQDHNDDGSPSSEVFRETTGLVVTGTPTNPVLYVSSSDFRIGGGIGGGSGDSGLDTNSGIITRFTWNGTSWDVVDIVRGLPRSEENHATNGLEFTTINGRDYLIVAQGGHTNGGAPSTNFNWTTEYALAAAVLSIDLTTIEGLPILNDNGRSYIYDIPTLDDPTRPNVNGIIDPDTPGYDGIDVNDPFGGNDGLNQAMVVEGGPVQVFSPGFRNTYDLVVTESGAVYVTDNGANAGWGGFPVNEGVDGTVTNDYDPTEPGSSSPSGGEAINNRDHLSLVTTDIQNYVSGSFYGGHPNPVRANPAGAGLFTAPDPTSLAGAVFRTQIYDPDGSTPGSTTDPTIGLPANWPPVPLSQANPVEGDWRGPGDPNPDGDNDDIITNWGTNTNGIDEYTATNFGGAMQGDLIAGRNGGVLRRLQLTPAGRRQTLTANFASGLGGNALGITCNSDTDPFPGTIWVATFNSNIVVLEPQDFITCIAPGEPGYDPLADYDEDGYTNQDEEDNGTDPCNGGSQPDDFDASAGGTLISDLNDTDDDNDGISDANDPFQLGNPNDAGSDAFTIPVENELFSDNPVLGGYLGLGFTGMMNNGDTDRNWLDWIDRRDDPNDPNPNDILGGAIGAMTMQMTSGTALGSTNTQEKGFQYGIQTDQTSGVFTVVGGMGNFNDPLQLYGNASAPNGELGIFIGDGTQSNYIKFVLTPSGLTALEEINDVPGTPVNLPFTVAERPNAAIAFYFVIDASDGTITLAYTLDNGTREELTTLTAQGSILQAIQQANVSLAVGLIGTSNAANVELEGTWDVLSVLDGDPFVVQPITESNVTVGTADNTFDLDTVFDDDNGVGNLTYTVLSNTNAANDASIVDNILTITYANVPAVSEITIRATDIDGNFEDHIITVTVAAAPSVLYRVNAGGPEIAAIDGEIAWEADLAAPNNSQFLVQAASDQVFGFPVTNFTPEVNLTTTPQDIFQTERFDNSAGTPNMTYSFPVAAAGNYEVRLYMANGYDGTDQPGDRIFDVTIEGITYPLLDEIDLSGTYGHQTGTVITHILNVTDGSIDISFVHSLIENPLLNGIEILEADDAITPIYVGPFADQTNAVGEQLDGGLITAAFGGDGNLNYSLSGQPGGINIDPTNGQIGGTVDLNAAAGSPYTVTVTVDDADAISSDAVSVTFMWTVTSTGVRINAGGALVAATDGESDWLANDVEGPVTTSEYSVTTGEITTTLLEYANRHPSIPNYIDQATFDGIFAEERFDRASGVDMEFAIPVGNGNYRVNLFMGNSFVGVNDIGDRIFDIIMEGAVVRSNFDIIAEFGHLRAGMLSFEVEVTDGELNIEYGRIVENPFINAIEVRPSDGTPDDFGIFPIADQTNFIGQAAAVSAAVFGGNPEEATTYTIDGQPAGVTIDTNSGFISGTIASAAAQGGPTNNGVYTVTVTATRASAGTVQTQFTWTVNDFSTFRINAGGATVIATDGESDWEFNDISGPFATSNYEVNTGEILNAGLLYENRHSSIPAYIDEATFNAIFAEERFDFGTNGDGFEMQFDVPLANGDYIVNLFVGNSFAGTSNIGDRVFDVNIEGVLAIDDVDIVAAFGHLSGGMLSYPVTVSDGVLNIQFVHQIENPTVNAIEIRLDAGAFDPIVVAPIADQTNNEDDVLDGSLVASATGGNPALDFVYAISGQPDGVTIDAATGVISGTINPGAATGGPSGNGIYTVEVTADKVGSSPGSTTFTWTVQGVGFWTDVDENENYTARHENSFVQAGDRFYVMGGRENATTVDVYDYANDSWEALTNSAPAAFNHFQAVEYKGLIWVIGAFRTNIFPNEQPAEFIWAFDPATREWIQGPEIPAGRRRGATGIGIYNDRFYIVGGNTEGHNEGAVAWFDEYDPATGTWTPLADAPNARDHFNAVVIQDRLYVAGGRLTGGPGGLFGPTIEEVDVYDFGTGLWSTLPADQNLPTPRAGAATVNFDDTLVIVGGEVPDQSTALDITEAYDPATTSWTRLPNLNHRRHGTQAIVSGGGIFILGGSPNQGGGNQRNLEYLFDGTPTGVPSVSSTVSAPTEVSVSIGGTVDIPVELSGGNVGIFVESITITGANAADFSITAGALTNALLMPNSIHTITVSDSGTTDSRSAVLTVNYANGQSVTTNLITNAGPTAVAVANPLTGEAPLTVIFDGSGSSDDSTITSYFWDFQDGTTSFDQNPIHTFFNVGVYVVSLTVTDDDGATDTTTVTITVTDPIATEAPVAVATATPLTGTAPLEVSFTGSNSTDDIGIESYLWNFQDGSTSNEADPVHIFTEAGIYEVTLTIEDAAGLTSSATVTITVNAANTSQRFDGVIFPNPATNVAQIMLVNQPDDKVVTKINLHDYSGRYITSYDPQEILDNGVYTLPIAFLTDGIYILNVEMNFGAPIILKLAVQN